MAEFKNRTLDFVLPNNFLHPDKYYPGPVTDEVFDNVPGWVASAIFDAMDADVVLDPGAVFLYLKNGLLPQYVVIYFMEIQGTRRKISTSTRFYRALYLVHMFREYVIVPPPHFLTAYDAASIQAVGRLAGDDATGTTMQQQAGTLAGSGPLPGPSGQEEEEAEEGKEDEVQEPKDANQI